MSIALDSPIQSLRLAVAAAIVGLAVGTLVCCNTTAGLGRDVQKVGDKIEDTANRRL